MGLNCSHGAFDGAYSAFYRFREAICTAAGGVWDNGDGHWHMPEEIYNENEGLVALLNHSDCDGEISSEMCVKVANDLEKLLPVIEKNDNGGGGHITRAGGFTGTTKKFIAGCREAARLGEPLEFG